MTLEFSYTGMWCSPTFSLFWFNKPVRLKLQFWDLFLRSWFSDKSFSMSTCCFSIVFCWSSAVFYSDLISEECRPQTSWRLTTTFFRLSTSRRRDSTSGSPLTATQTIAEQTTATKFIFLWVTFAWHRTSDSIYSAWLVDTNVVDKAKGNMREKVFDARNINRVL